MKVIFVTREGYQLSGARVRCYNFARELRRQGIEAGVFSFADSLGALYGEKEFEMSFVWKVWLNFRAFQVLVKEDSAAVFVLQRVNYHVIAPLLVALLKKNKVIFDCDDWNIREDPVYYFGFYPSSKMEYVTRLIARSAWRCMAASAYLRDYLKEFNTRVEYLPTGVDTDFFCPRARDKKDAGKIVFSWIGTAYHQEMGENIRFLLSCFAMVADRHENVVLSLAGEGKYFEQIKAGLAGHRHGQRVRVHGWIPADHIPGYLAGVDVGLLPLIQDTKFNKAKSPTKLFEYMSMAKPVVASDIGEAKFIVRNGETGFIARDQDAWVSSMCALVERAPLREHMGGKAREDVLLKYSLQGLGERLADVVRN